MSEKSIIVIGAGLAGFAVGSYGRMNGYRTHILEHHSEPGGVATAWKNKDYLIDGGIHYLMGHRPGQACHNLYRELGILHERHYPDLTTFVHFTDEITGNKVSFSQDLEQLTADLKKIAPEDTRIIDGFIAGVRAMQKADLFGLMETPPELMRLFGPLKQFWGMRRVLRYFGPEFNQPMEQYARAIKNDGLRRMFVNLFLPEVPVWFVMLILGLLAGRQLGLLTESCKDFVASLEERFKKLGGEVTYNATVQEIIVEHHRTVGVRLADGRELHADEVVATGDGHSAIYHLLGGRYLDKKLTERYENWKLISPIVTLSYGAACEFPQEPPLNFLLLKTPLLVGDVSLTGFPIRIFNYGGPFAPKGKTVVQALLHTDWNWWNDLQKDRPRYDAAKKKIGEEVLERLEPHYPGLTAKVEVTDVATPYTTWRYTLNREGAFMGWIPTPQAMRTQMRKTLPGLANFYMAGQWTVPGGGVPPCLYSGRHVIQILCKRDGKKFSASYP